MDRISASNCPSSPGSISTPGSPVLQPSPNHLVNQSLGSGSPVIQKPRHMAQNVQPLVKSNLVNTHSNSPHKITIHVHNAVKQQFNCVAVSKGSPQSPVMGTVRKTIIHNGYVEQQLSPPLKHNLRYECS